MIRPFFFEHLDEAVFVKTSQLTTGCTFHLDKNALNIFLVDYSHQMDDHRDKVFTSLLQLTW
ncbi:TPA: hypothetical protein DCG86_09435 [Candidatus Marinimicrobia bacterium]|nr:hypothetical protein [Candidatus Neomarinimicrobiota bacterium]HBY17819.1 hypothetical protein [Candidatus Neomarinimicrobiota bacterium]